jgi:anti-sigma factor RsiW
VSRTDLAAAIMSAQTKEPTEQQLIAQAYFDGELSATERADFEARMMSSTELAREVAELQRLHVLARRFAGPEPMDAEWRRLDQDPIQRAGSTLAYILLIASGAGLSIAAFAGLYLLEGVHPLVRLLLGLGLTGFLLLLALALRARLRTLPYDPYEEIER